MWRPCLLGSRLSRPPFPHLAASLYTPAVCCTLLALPPPLSPRPHLSCLTMQSSEPYPVKLSKATFLGVDPPDAPERLLPGPFGGPTRRLSGGSGDGGHHEADRDGKRAMRDGRGGMSAARIDPDGTSSQVRARTSPLLQLFSLAHCQCVRSGTYFSLP